MTRERHNLLRRICRWLGPQPSKRHEYPQFELSRAWKPSANLGPLPNENKNSTTQVDLFEENRL